MKLNRWQRIYDRDGYHCVYCGEHLAASIRVWHCATEDHLYPDNRGGASSDENLVAACQFCNSLKGDFIPPIGTQPEVLVSEAAGIFVNTSFREPYIQEVATEVAKRRKQREDQFARELQRITPQPASAA
jgi:hypothetical protein